MSAAIDAVAVIHTPVRNQLGEGPLWSVRDQSLYWVDILERTLFRLHWNDRRVECWSMPEMIGWIVEREHHPGFIAGFANGFAELKLDPLLIVPIADPEPHLPHNRMNDAKVDAWGRIWAGTMDIGAVKESGSLYWLDATRLVTTVDTGYVIANGPTFSLDGRIAFHTDSARRLIYQFEMADDGSVGPRSIFLDCTSEHGKPDGMTVDSEGALWVAFWGSGEVRSYDTCGRVMRTFALPATQVTSCAFGGKDMNRLFVTSAAVDRAEEALAGALFEIDAGVRGIPSFRYKA